MINKTRMEKEALEHAASAAGKFISNLCDNGYSADMEKWTPDIYDAFIEEVVTGFVERMQEIKKAIDIDPLSDVIPYE